MHYWARIAKRYRLNLTVGSSAMIDRVTFRFGRKLYEVPVGFKWFVDGLLDRSLGFGGSDASMSLFSTAK